MLEYLSPLLATAVKRSFNAGSTILYQGEVPRAACVLKSGVVRELNISTQGEEQILTFHVPGELFPSSWLFGKTSSTLFFYEAVSNCEVYFIPKDELLALAESNPKVQAAFTDMMATQYAAALMRIAALEQAKAREKILYTLYYLCQRYGKTRGKAVAIQLTLTHQDFANLVGLTRETTATELSRLKKKSIISYDNQHYLVNMSKLIVLIGEDSFAGMTLR